jgi:hypothetical protein
MFSFFVPFVNFSIVQNEFSFFNLQLIVYIYYFLTLGVPFNPCFLCYYYCYFYFFLSIIVESRAIFYFFLPIVFQPSKYIFYIQLLTMKTKKYANSDRKNMIFLFLFASKVRLCFHFISFLISLLFANIAAFFNALSLKYFFPERCYKKIIVDLKFCFFFCRLILKIVFLLYNSLCILFFLNGLFEDVGYGISLRNICYHNPMSSFQPKKTTFFAHRYQFAPIAVQFFLYLRFLLLF